ncbi:MAG TPA: polysaccharide deacetylase family protein [Polyangia bacterium]|nr:polysaccharide deacetylase family protein [Polyangia bacterium]
MSGRSVSLLALAAAVLYPTRGGGSDAVHALGPRGLVSKRSAARLTASAGFDRSAPEPGPSVELPLLSPGHGARTHFGADRTRRELLLSFDDGPDLKGTPLILEELDRRGLKAIFFVTGWRFAGQRPEDIARRDLLRKIATHGHLVANHTFSHHNLCDNPDETASQIDDNSEIITQVTGVRPLLFRAPYGAFCRSLDAALAARELTDIGWNLDPQDWKNNTPERIFRYLTTKLSRLEGRGILLMHDTHAASVRALPQLLDWVARENARAGREGRAPIDIIDYRAVLPPRPLAQSGLELVVGRLLADLRPTVQRLLPGAGAGPALP